MDKADGQGERTTGNPASAVQGAATRKAIVAATIAIIGERGWDTVKTRAVAERAGVPHGAVSYHFAGKGDLLRVAATEAVTQMFAAPIALARAAGGVAELLDGTLGWYSAEGVNDPSVTVLVEVLRAAAHDDTLRDRLAAELRAYRAAITDLVERDQRRGVITARPAPAAVAVVIAALLDGLLVHLLVDADLDAGDAATTIRALLFTEPDGTGPADATA